MKHFILYHLKRSRGVFAALVSCVLFATAARGDVVFAWNELLLHFAANSTNYPPHLEARVFAMMHLAIEDAVSTAGQKGGSPDAIKTAQRAAAVSAARTLLARLLPNAEATVNALAERHLAALANGADKSRGITAGEVAAERMVAARENDRWTEIAVFHAPADEGMTGEKVLAAALRGERTMASPWLRAVPFGLGSVEQVRVREVRTVNHGGEERIDLGLQHSRLFDHVDRTAAFEVTETLWMQRPVILWNRVARQIAASQSIDLAGEARLLAVLNVALADAAISCQHWRYAVARWRTVTTETWQPLDGDLARPTDIVTRNGDVAGDILRLQTQHILIPPTSNYPSAAATAAGAASVVLASFFKTDQISFDVPAARSAVPTAETVALRTFGSVSAAAKECAFVASLNGNHSREACIAGYSLGEGIARYLGKRPFMARR
jgi:hypothetical protein